MLNARRMLRTRRRDTSARARRVRESIGLSVVVALALTFVPAIPPALAADDVGTFRGTGEDAFTKQWFDETFEVALPDINESGLGKALFRARFETDTEATLSTDETVRVAELNHAAGEDITVQARRTGQGQLKITTRPALRINVDYEPDDDDLFECDMNHTRQTEPPPDFGDVYEPVPGRGDGDAKCGYLEVTASDIALLLNEPDVPDDFTLIDELFGLPKEGERRFEREEELFEIKVCKMLGNAFPSLRFLGDRCAFKVIGLVSADLVVPDAADGEPGGMYATHRLCGKPLTAPELRRCTDELSAPAPIRFEQTVLPEVVRYPPVCRGEDHELRWQLSDIGYRVHVRDVNLGVRVDFNARLRNRGEGVTFTIVEFPPDGPLALRLLRDLNGVDHVLDLDVRHPENQELKIRIGTLDRDQEPPTVDLGSSLQVPEGGAAQVIARPTGPDGRADNCTPPSDIHYEWRDGELSDPVSEAKVGDNTHGLPVPEGPAARKASLVVRDAFGNTATDEVAVDVLNVAPEATLSAPAGGTIVRAGTSVSFAAEAVDPGVEDALTYSWDFGDGTGDAATTLDRTHATTHAYAVPCICTTTLDVADDDGGAATTGTGEVVVFDPAAGKLSGGAKFIADGESIGIPPGSVHSLNATVQYEATANAPKGLVDLDARLAGISVRSTSLAFLVVTPSEAIAEGEAMINGVSGYAFGLRIATASDGRATAMRMDVWRPGISSPGAPDLRASGPLDIGLIKTH